MKIFADSAGLVLVHFCSIFADSAGLVLVLFWDLQQGSAQPAISLRKRGEGANADLMSWVPDRTYKYKC